MVRAGLAYAARILALGFALGVVRTVWLAPRIGPVAAVACELPLMLGASVWTARALMARYAVTHGARALGMGAVGLALLLLAEWGMAVTLAGQSTAQWLAAMRTPAGALGLAGQGLFGLIPAILCRRSAT
ncbi:hypothetical protein GTZ99_15685 [Novosphingobium sp. FSY-8]|uniref:Uncharacterized protein n=1 Tax=Novosphingobium ovatum TaxID=1908523 RepID=A0ABW9XHL8_9SPHN|nr:hypothetical protein [Novosphingobium ovatum]NBC37996.1 hypothetical protein [Novosphingobium ovatum]